MAVEPVHPEHHEHGSELSETELRVRALETVLTQKGYVDPAALDRLIDTYETKVGPRNGARVVARAWANPEYRTWLLEDATAAIASMGFEGRQSEHIVAVENTPQLHNMVVCTLCSCYPWPVLGLPPVWYSRRPIAPRRSRIRAACSRISDLRCLRAPRSGSGIRPRKFAIWCCRCG